MSTRYRVTADNPTYTDCGTLPSVFSKGDILRSQHGTTAADCIDSDGDVLMVHDTDTDRGGHIAFAQLQKVDDAPAPDTFLTEAAERLGLVAELDKILRVATALRDLETTVRETRA